MDNREYDREPGNGWGLLLAFLLFIVLIAMSGD